MHQEMQLLLLQHAALTSHLQVHCLQSGALRWSCAWTAMEANVQQHRRWAACVCTDCVTSAASPWRQRWSVSWPSRTRGLITCRLGGNCINAILLVTHNCLLEFLRRFGLQMTETQQRLEAGFSWVLVCLDLSLSLHSVCLTQCLLFSQINCQEFCRRSRLWNGGSCFSG